MQTPFKMDIWLQSYEDFFNAKNNIKHKNLNTVFGNISKTISLTSDSFLLIMSHILITYTGSSVLPNKEFLMKNAINIFVRFLY